MVPHRSNRAEFRTFDRQSTPSPTGHKKTRWYALVHVGTRSVHVWCALVHVWCTFVFFGAVFVRIGAVWCTYGGENKQNVPHYRHHPFPMLPFAEHKKQVLTCVPYVEQREHVLNMFNTREHRAAQRNKPKHAGTTLSHFPTAYPQHFSTDKKTEATVLAASVG